MQKTDIIDVVTQAITTHPEWSLDVIAAIFYHLIESIQQESDARARAEVALIKAYDSLNFEEMDSALYNEIGNAVVACLIIQDTKYHQNMLQHIQKHTP